MIHQLHHNAYRCRDSEATRRFYEDFLGLPLAGTLEIGETKSGRKTQTLHTFYRLGDGSFLAFFEAPDMPFEFKPQHDYDLHLALEVDPAVLPSMLEQGGGSIVNFGSVSWLNGEGGYPAYTAAKAAVDARANNARTLLSNTVALGAAVLVLVVLISRLTGAG